MDAQSWRDFASQTEPQLLHICRTLDLSKINKASDLPETLLLHQSMGLRVYYAPFGLQRPRLARIMIVGLTPGFAQAFQAYQAWQKAEGDLDLYEELFIRNVVFAGPTRQNLIRYLDELGIAAALDLRSSAQLFTDRQNLLAAFSLLRYPVFVGPGLKNYGGTDAGHKNPFLQSMIQHLFAEILQRQGPHTLIVPMGKYPARVLQVMAEKDPHLESRTLLGFPHTSGSNGHRHAQFQAGKKEFQQKVTAWRHCPTMS